MARLVGLMAVERARRRTAGIVGDLLAGAGQVSGRGLEPLVVGGAECVGLLDDLINRLADVLQLAMGGISELFELLLLLVQFVLLLY